MADRTFDEKLNSGQDFTDAEVEALYMAALSAETPDLWDRISAGIAADAPTTGNAPTQAAAPAMAEVTNLAEYRKKKRMPRAVRASLAAAALLLVVGIPAYILGGQRSRTKDESQKTDNVNMEMAFDMQTDGTDSVAGVDAATEAESPMYDGEVNFTNEAKSAAESTTEALEETDTLTAPAAAGDMEKAKRGFHDYVATDIKSFARYLDPMEFDVTGDGQADLVGNVTIGSGWESTMIVVYDPVAEKGYRLSGRSDDIDYFASGIEDGKLIVKKLPGVLGNDEIPEEGIPGTIVFEDGRLIFVED